MQSASCPSVLPEKKKLSQCTNSNTFTYDCFFDSVLQLHFLPSPIVKVMLLELRNGDLNYDNLHCTSSISLGIQSELIQSAWQKQNAKKVRNFAKILLIKTTFFLNPKFPYTVIQLYIVNISTFVEAMPLLTSP